MTAWSDASLLGAQLGGYQLVEQLGVGGMGAVYRAHDVSTGAIVAVKVLRGSGAHQPTVRARFQLEAEAGVAIDHPNVIKVHELAFDDDGSPFMTMELLHGETLDAVIDTDGPLDCRRAGRIARELARGLAAAHDQGFVHRDLKPGNVMVLNAGTRAEQIKIFDFGIVATGSEAASRITHDGLVVGTPAYTAPEQLMGTKIDPRADLYALGIVLYEMLAGRVPFSGSFREIIAQHMFAPPPPLPASSGLEVIAARLLAKDRSDRYASAHDVITAIDQLLGPDGSPKPIMAKRDRVRPPRWRWIHAGIMSVSMSLVFWALLACFGLERHPTHYTVEPLEQIERPTSDDGTKAPETETRLALEVIAVANPSTHGLQP